MKTVLYMHYGASGYAGLEPTAVSAIFGGIRAESVLFC